MTRDDFTDPVVCLRPSNLGILYDRASPLIPQRVQILHSNFFVLQKAIVSVLIVDGLAKKMLREPVMEL